MNWGTNFRDFGSTELTLLQIADNPASQIHIRCLAQESYDQPPASHSGCSMAPRSTPIEEVGDLVGNPSSNPHARSMESGGSPCMFDLLLSGVTSERLITRASHLQSGMCA